MQKGWLLPAKGLVGVSEGARFGLFRALPVAALHWLVGSVAASAAGMGLDRLRFVVRVA